MNRINYTLGLVGLVAGSLAFTNSAVAFNFTTNFTTNPSLTGNQRWQGDILLDSVQYGSTIVNEFALVNRVNILSNDAWTGGNTGAASADMGDLATVGVSQEFLTESAAVTALGNRYLSSIIDTEDSGSFAMNLFFDKAVDNLYFFERGRNSKLDVQAIDGSGNLIGNLLALDSGKNVPDWQDAGYQLNTLEIADFQTVGSRGVSIADLGVTGPISGIRVFSRGSAYQGPDFKVVGSVASVPEPGTIVGLGIVTAGFMASRRRHKNG
jgi:hypothetical protein